MECAPAPADPYNCADGFANWQAGWSVPKKEWCCRVHGKGCPGQAAGGCPPTAPPPRPIVPVQPILPPVMPVMPTMPPRPADPYNCADGFANWQAGWSVPKKEW